jgi:uncharacterized protein
MMPDILNEEDRRSLLQLARQALEQTVLKGLPEPLLLENLSPCLQEMGASFVTLTRRGELRGCIGALDASLPLAQDVREHAAAAALQDYRFPPVLAEELPEIEIEISILTAPQPLEYTTPEELLKHLRPLVDGVVLRDGARQATFLPQVWEKVPDPELFLNQLCRKMGAVPNAWRCRPLHVFVYQVEKVCE